MSDGDATKYNYVMENFDIDDFELWLSWKKRDNNIEKWQYDNMKEKSDSNGGSSRHNGVSRKMDEKQFMEFWENQNNK